MWVNQKALRRIELSQTVTYILSDCHCHSVTATFDTDRGSNRIAPLQLRETSFYSVPCESLDILLHSNISLKACPDLTPCCERLKLLELTVMDSKSPYFRTDSTRPLETNHIGITSVKLNQRRPHHIVSIPKLERLVLKN